MNGTTVILANGALPVHPVPVGIFAAAGRVVCCDGAYAKSKVLGRDPDLVVGDGDSLSSEEKTALGARYVRIAEQETNDLAKAFREVVSRYGADGIAILGADGLREDHFLGNVFRLLEFSQLAPDCRLVTNAGTFSVVVDESTMRCCPGEAVSVFAPTAGTRVESTGLAWPLGGVDLTALWSGTLNRAIGNSFTLSTSSPIIVYRPHSAVNFAGRI